MGIFGDSGKIKRLEDKIKRLEAETRASTERIQIIEKTLREGGATVPPEEDNPSANPIA